MSITVSNCDEINRSPVNNSTAKMLYTFSRSQRFPKRRRILCDKFYQSQSSVHPSRTTTFGFGNKYQFTKDVPDTPPPNTYNLQSDFAPSPKKGFGFGEGRNQMEITGPFVNTIRNKNPGPGSYKSQSTLKKSAYSMGGKQYKEDKQKKLVPGPGSYGISFPISPDGNYYLAKYKNSLAKNFSKLQNRPLTVDSKFPGPGAYDLKKQLFSNDGKYITSKMHNCFVRKFGSSMRSNINLRKVTPGPGNYKLPSEFGHYVSKEVYNSQKNSPSKSQNKQNNIN